MTITQAYLNGKKVIPNMFRNSNELGYAECLVEIEWLTDVYTKDKQRKYLLFGNGIFTTQLVVCSLDKQVSTKQKLEKHLKLISSNF